MDDQGYVALFGTGPTAEKKETLVLLGSGKETFVFQSLTQARLLVSSQFVVVIGKSVCPPVLSSVRPSVRLSVSLSVRQFVCLH